MSKMNVFEWMRSYGYNKPLQLFIFTDVIRCSRLPLCVGYFINLKFISVSSNIYQLLYLVQLKKQIG